MSWNFLISQLEVLLLVGFAASQLFFLLLTLVTSKVWRTSSTELKALNWFSLCFEALTIQWNLFSSSSSSSYFTKRVMGNFTNRQNEFPLAFFFFLAQALLYRIQILSLSKVLILKSLLLFNSEIWSFSGVAWQHSQQYSFKHLL